MVPAVSVNKTPSKFWMRCSQRQCKTYVDTYVPLPHQADIHEDSHRYKGVFGGYGSGKTQCTIKDDEKHMLITPMGTTIVGSAVLAQVEETWEKDWANDFPEDFIASQNKQKKTYQLINGHTLLIKSYYDEELLRSLNVTRFHMVEASAIDYEIFTQLKTRLRNDAGTKQPDPPVFDPDTNTFLLEADWRTGIIESNPSAGWIRNEFLLQSSKIDPPRNNYIVKDPNKEYSSYIIPTKKNIFLPPTFYEDNARNKPSWWIARFLNGSFDYAEGLVYTNAFSTLIDSFDIPAHYPRMVAMDYGIRDNTSFIFLAVDTKPNPTKRNPDGLPVIYAFFEMIAHDQTVSQTARQYRQISWDMYGINPYGMPVMDGRSINKRNDVDLKTIGDLFQDEGIFFKAAQMDLNTRILRVNELIESGRLFIFKDKCPVLAKEIMDYKFPERNSDGTTKKGGDKPIDKNNHSVNALEFGCMEINDEIVHKAYDGKGHLLVKDKPQIKRKVINPYGLHALSETNTSFGTGGNNDIPW